MSPSYFHRLLKVSGKQVSHVVGCRSWYLLLLKYWNDCFWTLQVYILKKEEGGRHKPFITNYQPQMYVRTGDVAATITLPEGKEFVMPGDDASFTVTLMFDMPLEVGLRFTLREGSKTVGTGVVTEILEWWRSVCDWLNWHQRFYWRLSVNCLVSMSVFFYYVAVCSTFYHRLQLLSLWGKWSDNLSIKFGSKHVTYLFAVLFKDSCMTKQSVMYVLPGNAAFCQNELPVWKYSQLIVRVRIHFG